ncbi:MAG: carbohydrate ABC transporter permease [Eubacteriales bacterium]
MKSTVKNIPKAYAIMMLVLSGSLPAILFLSIVFGDLTEVTLMWIHHFYIGVVLLMSGEQIIRIIRISKSVELKKLYWDFEKIEIFWLVSVPITFFFMGSLPLLKWFIILKVISVLRLFNDENVFQIVVKSISILLVVFFVLPFLNVFSTAISAPGQFISFFPQNIDLWAFKYVLSDKGLWQALGNSLFVSIVGTAISVSIVVAAAFPLSKMDMPFRKSVMLFFTVSMLFSGGMAPKILLADALGIMDTLWALILPQVVIVYHMILLKSFFETIPLELEESAKLDGASNLQILTNIIMPIAKPMIATITSFTVVVFWNDINSSILYLTAKDKYPLPMYVRNFLNMNPMDIAQYDAQLSIYWEPLKMSYIFASILPIIIAYPLIFRYMKSDISAGAVKG